jgi:diadenosine tetraphosphatase ApaH/serine/threonine PP2A family protein phosphatase
MGVRTIFIGDVHGCVDELKEMIGILGPTREDRIILLGDLINRGPDSPGVVRFVFESGFESLMGNHEYEYLRHYTQIPVFKKIREGLGQELHSWLEGRPLFIETDAFLAVHAGLFPGKHPAETPEEVLLNIRTVRPEEGFDSDLNRNGDPAWHTYYKGTKPVFYGHWARQGLTISHPTYGLDSGCVYGRALSAYVLETGELIQVPAKSVYYRKPYDSSPESG